MSISKRFLRKLAVAALAVAGVLGVAWAILPSDVKNTASMGVTYQVQSIAEIDVTPHNPTNEELLKNDTLTVTGGHFGTLGTIKVTTNSTGWDVWMTTANGGQLADIRGIKTIKSCPSADWLTGITDSSKCTDVPDPSKPAPILKYADATPVQLGVAVGLAKTGTAIGAGAPATIYPIFSAASVFIPPVSVDPADLTTAIRPASGAPTDYISFAGLLGGTWSGTTPGGQFDKGIYGTTGETLTSASGWTTISGDGFPLPTGNSVDGEEYFYVNVGINTSTKLLGGNEDGYYSETFYFDLVANF
jgi:hypothetical protein